MFVTHQARDAAGTRVYPDWLVKATDGGTEAKAAWEKAVADLAALRNEDRRVISEAARVALPGQSRPKRPEISTADYEAVMNDYREVERARTAGERRVKKAREAFDGTMAANSTADRRAVAAKVALDEHDAVVVAWEALERAILARDEALVYAGRPGRAWQESSDATGFDPIGDIRKIMKAAIRGFDRHAAQIVADGGDADYEPAPSGQTIRPLGRAPHILRDAAEVEERK